jgi:hypothetical protein
MATVAIPKLEQEGNFKLENFGRIELAQARAAVREVKDLCQLIQRAIAPPNLGGVKIAVRTALSNWFGVADDAGYNEMKARLAQLGQAQLTGQITLVYRSDIVVKDAAGAPAMLGDGTAFTGGNVFGYVHHQQAGSGYRVVCGRLFITDPTPYFASTTIYHEMSHKVLRTVDLGYGDQLCLGYARQGVNVAKTNADNYAYFAIAIGNARARL